MSRGGGGCPCFCGGHADAIDLCLMCFLARCMEEVAWRRGVFGLASASPSFLLAGVYAMPSALERAEEWGRKMLTGLDVEALIKLHTETFGFLEGHGTSGRTVSADQARWQLPVIYAYIQKAKEARDRIASVGVQCPVCVAEPSAAVFDPPTQPYQCIFPPLFLGSSEAWYRL